MIRVRIDYHRDEDVKDGKPWHLTINGVLYSKFVSKKVARQAMWDIDAPTATAFLEEGEKDLPWDDPEADPLKDIDDVAQRAYDRE